MGRGHLGGPSLGSRGCEDARRERVIIVVPRAVSLVEDMTITYTNWLALFWGPGGILGLAGAWLRFLFQQRLSRGVSIFNWVVCFLLLSGVAAVFWVLFANGVEYFLKSYFPFTLLAVAVYGTYLAITVVVPNYRLDPTSGSA